MPSLCLQGLVGAVLSVGLWAIGTYEARTPTDGWHSETTSLDMTGATSLCVASQQSGASCLRLCWLTTERCVEGGGGLPGGRGLDSYSAALIPPAMANCQLSPSSALTLRRLSCRSGATEP